MSTAILWGLAFAAGVLTLAAGVSPTPLPLANALARLDAPRSVTRAQTEPASFLERMVGRPLAASGLGRSMTARLSCDLRILGRSPDEHMAKTALSLMVGLLWAPATAAMMAIGGVHVSLAFPLWLSLVLAVVGAMMPGLAAKAEARTRRQSFRHAFGCYLDLVAVRLAGGAGIESALTTAAGTGDGWAFAELRDALTDSRLLGEPLWNGLANLGSEIGVSELTELAASTGLAGDEGARVRTSIVAKARALRFRGLTDAEATAQSASERMSLPVVGLMLGFIVFLAWPAVLEVTHGL